MSRKVYVIRHGETYWNHEGKMQGQTDAPMNDTGRAQAAELARELKELVHFDIIVSSHLSRAKETAEIIAGSYNTPVKIDPGFSEMGYGDWEGMSFAELRLKWPGEMRAWQERGDFRGPGGETVESLIDRVWKSFRYWADTQEYQNMAIVTHGSAGRALMCKLIGENPRALNQYALDNAFYYVVTVIGKGAYSIEDKASIRRVIRR